MREGVPLGFGDGLHGGEYEVAAVVLVAILEASGVVLAILALLVDDGVLEGAAGNLLVGDEFEFWVKGSSLVLGSWKRGRAFFTYSKFALT